MSLTKKTARKWFSTVALASLVLTPLSAKTAEIDDDPDFLPMYQKNFAPLHEERTPELNVVYLPDVLTTSSTTATFACSHGFPWESDTRVPLFFYGQGVHRHLTSTQDASLEDVVPTLARLLDVEPPPTADGRVLCEAMRRPLAKKSQAAQSSSRQTPRLAMVMTLDQARADYLTNPQIAPALDFTLSHLLAEGSNFSRARLSFAGSRTAVSHTVLGTGATPGIHGIVGNNIRVGDAFPLAYNDDPRHSMDMFNLTAPTFADVMDLELDNEPVIISMSPYGRAALGMGGHGATFSTESDRDVVVQLLMDTGLPYTNDEYFSLPETLVLSPDNPIRIDQWLLANYNIDLHTDSWTESTVITDNGPYAVPHDNVITGPQGSFPDGTSFSFSHPLVGGGTAPDTDYQLWDADVTFPANSYYGSTMNTPFYQLWAVDMLLKAMESEDAGLDAIPDLVFYNFKCLDKVGHKYGINSPEVYTYLYYVDYCLKKITCWLDRKVGKNNYLMVVTADHGAHNAEGDRLLYNRDLFNSIEEAFGKDVVLNDPDDGAPFDDMIYLDEDILATGGFSQEDVAHFIETTFSDHVYRVYTRNEIFAAE